MNAVNQQITRPSFKVSNNLQEFTDSVGLAPVFHTLLDRIEQDNWQDCNLDAEFRLLAIFAFFFGINQRHR